MRDDSDGDGILDKLIRDVLSEMCLLSRDVDEVKGQALWIFRMRVFEEEASGKSKDSEMGKHKEVRMTGEEQT